MKTKKSLLLVIFALVGFVLTASCLFTACVTPEEPVETYAITWNVPADTAVAVEGYDALPETAEKGTELVFTVTPPTGYTSTVKTTTTIAPKDGTYTVKISKDTTITVTNERKVASVEVTKVEGAAFAYFAGEELDKSTVNVTVNYEVGESEVITTGYTVNPTLFVIGDTEFTISYKGVTSEPVALDAPVEGREFGFVKVELELGADGKPYYVLYGTYSNYDEAKFTEVGFDFQEQGFYSEANGGAAGWAYVLYDTKIEEFANGLFTLRVDMSALATNLTTAGIGSMLFNPHMGFNPPGDNSGNLNVDTTNYEEGQTITTADGVSYTLHRTENDESVPQAETTWGMVGVIVSDPTAPKLVNAALEKSGDKAYLVINGTMTAPEEMTDDEAIAKLTALYAYYDYMDLQSYALADGSMSPAGTGTRVPLSYEDGTITLTYNREEGTFQIRLDLSGLTAGLLYMFHTSDADGGNLSLGVAEGATEITVGTVTYAVFDSTQFTETDSWLRSCLTVMVTDSSAA